MRTSFGATGTLWRLTACDGRNYASGRVYLRAALLEPVMAVLENDGLNLEIEPIKVFSNLTPAERKALGFTGEEQAVTADILMAHPGMREYLESSAPGLFFVRVCCCSLTS